MKIDVVSVELAPLYQMDLEIESEFIYGISEAKKLFSGLIGRRNVEAVAVACLNQADKLINASVVSIGGVENTQVSIAEIFKVALLSNAVKIIVAHNHPSGILCVTSNDISMTKNIGIAARLFKMELVDSIIVNALGEAVSIRENAARKESDVNA